MRRTTNVKQAMERAANFLGFRVTPVGRSKYNVSGPWGNRNWSAKKALAHMVEMTDRGGGDLSALRDAVRFTGAVPSSGLSPWQRDAINRLRLQ